MTYTPTICPECGEPANTRRCAPVPRPPTFDEPGGFRYYNVGPKWWECENGHWELIGPTSSVRQTEQEA